MHVNVYRLFRFIAMAYAYRNMLDAVSRGDKRVTRYSVMTVNRLEFSGHCKI